VRARFSDTPGKVRFAGRPNGSDNVTVYRERLGLGDEELRNLRERGVI
jgi:hypothetical protein